MNTEFSKYHCEEFFDEHYEDGLFHPTEPQDLLAHKELKIDNKNQFLQIGQIWDDHDLVLGYRKGLNGIYGRSNYNGECTFFSNSIKEFTEGWYQKDSNYWDSLTQYKIWSEVEHFYQNNQKRYNWKVKGLLNFIQRALQTQLSSEVFVKGYKNQLGISLKNGFIRRPFENMVNLVVDEGTGNYTSHFQSSFFDWHSSAEYESDKLDELIEDIRKWIMKSV
ncbi:MULTISPECIES: hypothetical protein [Roseivirga]|mgnify:CR=1 FL=1|uniref:hypothetical protein n=1 Tax=Roseivirga TaxID=290180 RepID=UPI001B27B225|nr:MULTISPECIES: hypothetical protein [Roseivirga]MBO6660146.1 hypothetical protein [Roseivirga sp.]MBO6759351.1 hypothetical protein [Roseivirga sp.]MBO6907117.1 hypothetical protein [Roseivirga sp.]WPZ09514.1 hypothetical protein T7867_14715 [Roseivirga spongicola]